MSTEQVDPELVEKTKQQIRSLVNEIVQLSKSSISPLEFYTEFLNRVVGALAAIGGAVWTISDDGQLALQYQMNLRETGLLADREGQMRHSRLLNKVLQSGDGMLVAPQSGAGDDAEAGNPTDLLLVLGPLATGSHVRGVVEVFQRPVSAVNTQRGYLRFLLQMCELAADFLKTRELKQYTDRQQLWTQLAQFTSAVHKGLDPRETAFTIANEGRRLIECDRVTVCVRHGRKVYVEAISGQDTFDKRSNVVTLLNRLTQAVAATGDPVWYTGDTSQMPPQVEDAVQAYVDEAHSKTVAVLPLKRPMPEPEPDEPPRRPEIIGALVVEQIEDARPREGMLQRVDVVAEHSATALSNSLEHHTLFLLPVWKTLGKATWFLRAKTLPKTVAVAVAIAAAIAALVFIPADFELEGRGALQPVTRRGVFARIDGIVDDIPVKHDQAVTEGQVLVKLRNTELEAQLEGVLGELAQTQADITATNSALLERKLSDSERSNLESQLPQLYAKAEGLKRQYALYQTQMKELVVHSPLTGRVTTWDPEQKLRTRPVQRGNKLLDVAVTDPPAEWELEVQMPEDRLGHIRQAQGKLQEDLPVSYILASDPGTVHEGRLKEIHRSAEVRGEEGNTVLLRVAIDRNDVREPRPGATVRAKVYCGQRSIGYVWFHDAMDFVRTTWFRYL